MGPYRLKTCRWVLAIAELYCFLDGLAEILCHFLALAGIDLMNHAGIVHHQVRQHTEFDIASDVGPPLQGPMNFIAVPNDLFSGAAAHPIRHYRFHPATGG